MSLFLTADEVAELTDCRRKSRQIDALRMMGIAFWVNPSGRPVVARASIEGGQLFKEERDMEWTPAINGVRNGPQTN
jgi:hypothetical protein